MADIRIKDLATTATTTASDDFMAVDGAINGTRKLSAATPAFLTSVTTPSLTSPAATNLTLGTTDSGAAITVLTASNYVGIGTATPQGKLEVSASSVTVNVVSPDNASLNIIRGATTNYNNLRFGTGNSTTFTEDWSLQTRADADSGNQFSITRGSNTDTFVIKKSNGYVGIGTATPSSKLEVSGSASGNTVIVNGGQLILRDFDSTVGGQVQLYNKLANSGFSIKNTGATGTSVLQFSKDSTDVLAISNTGDVSIASTTAGSSGAGALVVQGGLATGAASYIGGALSIAAGGNFIVGSSASTGQSNIQFGNSGGGSQIGVESVGGGSLATGSTAYATVVGSYTNTALQLFTNGTVRLTISNTGAATFAGTVSPQQATTAAAPAYVKGAIYFDTTLNKLRVGGATAYETITSV